MPAKINTLYEVHNSKDGSNRVILVETIAGEVERVKSFGFVSVFDVSSVLQDYTNDEFNIMTMSVSGFKKKFSKELGYAGIEL